MTVEVVAVRFRVPPPGEDIGNDLLHRVFSSQMTRAGKTMAGPPRTAAKAETERTASPPGR
jgi:hypothetical protein